MNDPRNPNSPSQNSVGQLVEDAEGSIWFATWGGGLNCYHPVNKTFEFWTADDKQPERRISSNRIQSVSLAKNGILWIGTHEGGLSKLDPKTGQVKNYFPSPKGLLSDRVWSIREANDGSIWLATDVGINRLDPETDQFQQWRHHSDPKGLPNARVKALHFDRDGVLWIGTQEGLARMGPKDPYPLLVPLPGNKSGANDDIKSLISDDHGHLWIGTMNSGLICYEIQSKLVTRYLYDPANLNSLSDNTIENLYIDRSQLLWISTYRGLSKLDLKPTKFRSWGRIQDGSGPFTGNGVACMYQDEESETLWVGTFSGGLNLLAKAATSVKVYASKDYPGLSDDIIRTILKDRQGLYWLGTYRGGLVSFQPESETFTSYQTHPVDPYSISDNCVRAAVFNQNGKLWLGTNKGLNLFNPLTKTFMNINNDPQLVASVGDARINHFIMSRDGTLWLGTQEGLIHFDPNNYKALRHGAADATHNGLSHREVMCVMEDKKGQIWAGTAAGLNCLNPNTGVIQSYFSIDGLNNNVIRGILEDRKGRIWISTEGGLSRYEPENNSFHNYGVEDGLPGVGFSAGAFLKSKDAMYFGGQHGMIAFSPENFPENTYEPPVVFTRLRLFYQDYPLAKPLYLTDELVLQYHQNVLSIDFAALDYTRPEKNRYRYRIKGFNDDWIELGFENRITSTNLDPGHYELQVMGSNSDQIWSDKVAVLQLKIIPPFWRQPWALVSYALLGIMAGIGIPALRIRSLQKRRNELAALVEERTHALLTSNAALGSINKELLGLDEIVGVINKEHSLNEVEKTILAQGLKLSHNIERGCYLRFDPSSDQFTITASHGHPKGQLENIHFNRTQVNSRYIEGQKRLCDGIFLVSPEGLLYDETPFSRMEQPAAMLVIILSKRNMDGGILILESYSDQLIFHESELERLRRFSDHAITAIAKARMMRELEETAASLKQTQRLLLTAAHQAGMAEVATNLLHNVGNTLNSINTSTEIIRELNAMPVFHLLKRIADLLKEHDSELETFIRETATGLKVAHAFKTISTSVIEIHEKMDHELISQLELIENLRTDVLSQERYATDTYFVEEVTLEEIAEEALSVLKTNLKQRGIALRCAFENTSPLHLPRVKLVRVLVILINSAMESMVGVENKKLTILTKSQDYEMIMEISDTGHGIPKTLREQVFHQNVLSMQKDPGFGLHYCGNAIKEMHGQIRVLDTEVGTRIQLSFQETGATTMA